MCLCRVGAVAPVSVTVEVRTGTLVIGKGKEGNKMAKYDVKYACGHTVTIQLYGPEKDRQRKIAYYEQYYSCPDCYAREKDEKKCYWLFA